MSGNNGFNGRQDFDPGAVRSVRRRSSAAARAALFVVTFCFTADGTARAAKLRRFSANSEAGAATGFERKYCQPRVFRRIIVICVNARKRSPERTRQASANSSPASSPETRSPKTSRRSRRIKTPPKQLQVRRTSQPDRQKNLRKTNRQRQASPKAGTDFLQNDHLLSMRSNGRK